MNKLLIAMAQEFQYFMTIYQAIKDGKPFNIDRINLSGSRKSAKTWSAIMFMVLTLMTKKTKVYAFRNMSDDAGELFKMFKVMLEHFGVMHLVTENKTYKTLTLWNGSVIEIRSLRRVKNEEIKLAGMSDGIGFDLGIVFAEERHEITNKDWSSVMQAIRGHKQVLQIHASNPWLETNDYVKYCSDNLNYNITKLKQEGQQFAVKDVETNIDELTVISREIFHYTNYQINEFLTKKDGNRLVVDAGLDPHRKDTILYGYPGSPEGSIWGHVIDKLLADLHPDDEPIEFVGGVDYGEKADACTAYIVGFNRHMSHAHIEHEYYWANKPSVRFKDTSVLADDIVKHYIEFIESYENLNQVIYIEVDSSAVAFITALNNTCEEYGWEDQIQFVQCKKYKVAERVEQIKTMAALGMITIDSKCSNLIREYQSQTYSSKSSEYRDGDDHGTDAVEYALARRWVELIDNLQVSKDLMIERLNKSQMAEREN